MPVERAHDPERWEGYAVTRQDLAKTIREFERIMGEDGAKSVEVGIRMPGFEGEFESVDEWLAEIADDEWVGMRFINATVTVGEYPNTIRVSLDTGMLTPSLSIRGGTRRDRNALWPDLKTAAARHARPVRSTGRITAYSYAVVLPVALVLWFVCILVSEALGVSNATSIAIGWIVAVPVMWLGFSRLFDTLHSLSPDVEFLPDDGISRWDRARDRWFHGVRLAGIVVVGLSTVAAAVFGAISLSR